MVHYDVFTEPVYRTYRAPECSWASFYIKIINVLKYFLPLLTIFLTEGLWKKTGTFREIPDISFTGDFIVSGYGYDRSIIATSYPVLSSAASIEQLSTSQVSHYFDENVENNDKKLMINFQMTTQNITMTSLSYAFVIQFKLDYHSIVFSELILTDIIQFSSPVSKIITSGRLGVDQSKPFEKREIYMIIDNKREDVEHYQMNSVFDRQMSAPIALIMSRKSSILMSSPSPPSMFSISLSLSYSDIEFMYRTGFWELLKWAWIQYFAFYVIFNHMLCSITSYVFRNRVFFVTDVIRK